MVVPSSEMDGLHTQVRRLEYLCIVAQEDLRSLDVAVIASVMQGSPAVGILVVYVRATGDDILQHLVTVFLIFLVPGSLERAAHDGVVDWRDSEDSLAFVD